jgi:hypothetical protein
MNLPQRIVAIHDALDSAHVAHAFGGAIALAYWTENPRGTRDIDVNIFLAADECETGLMALPTEIRWDEADRAAIVREGQRRLWWDETPIDVFFDYHRIHVEAEANRRFVQFEDTEIPILGPTELAVFKAMFDRTRDWADIEEMSRNGTLDLKGVRATVAEMVGEGDPRLERLNEAARRGSN